MSAFKVVACIKTNGKNVQINHPDWLEVIDLLPSFIKTLFINKNFPWQGLKKQGKEMNQNISLALFYIYIYKLYV